ncbi:helix-turn-helix transcriptional regulator [Erwinia sp. Eh17-17]|jgi:transcriptional regulator with XRE-family HTH domain|uniref:helix-turn-helix transcriptional regulator n=1 Tax=Erwinia sp. Eh17-17 TaxID=3080330 RepID=UPI003209962F
MLPHRLKEARKKKGISQQKLGVLAGIDESSSSARMNQYEQGTHTPNFDLMCRVADILDVPVCFFYTVEDELAIRVCQWHDESKKR